jgi:hypothetical protein
MHNARNLPASPADTAGLEDPMRHRLIAAVTAVSLMAAATPARADEPSPSATPGASASGDQPAREKTFVRNMMFVGYGVSAAAFVTSFVFLGMANSAYNDRRAIARSNGEEQLPMWSCTSPEQCERMSDRRGDQDTARVLWATTTGIGIAGAAVGTTMLIALLAMPSRDGSASSSTTPGNVRLAPAIGPKQAGLGLQGVF